MFAGCSWVNTSRVTYVTNTLLVVDGHSMAFRAFYALPVENFTSQGGQATNAVYGFLSMLVRLIETEKPSHIAVAFDLSRKSFRTEEYPEYKGTRDETPVEFIGQVEIIREILSAMGIITLTKENYEADDILATLASQGEKEQLRVLVASGDRDTFQLINDQVTVLYPGRSASDLNYMTPQAVEDRYGVTPNCYPELAALVGETSDNLPGVPGVGPKTAAQWLSKYGGLQGLLESADKIGGKRGEALREHTEAVLRNRHLNRLVDDLELPVGIGELIPSEPQETAMEQLFDTLEFQGLRKRVYAALGLKESETRENLAETNPDMDLVSITSVEPETDVSEWITHVNSLKSSGMGDQQPVWAMAYTGVGDPVEGDLDSVALFQKGRALVFSTSLLTPVQENAVVAFLQREPRLVVHGGKAANHAFACRGWALPEPVFDTELAAYLCHPERRGYELSELVGEYLGKTLSKGEEEDALFSLESASADGLSQWIEKLAEEASLIAQLWSPLSSKLDGQSMLPLLTGMEIPVQTVLTQIEAAGVAMDTALLDQLSMELGAEAQRAESDAFAAIGHTTNLASPKQLQTVLFEELAMPKTRKTKTGWTTDAGALADLYAKTEHPFLEALLRHRDNTKLRQMVDGLRSEVKSDGRIHTTFHQTVTATGRLASSEPNLQNIPARTETGMRIRGAFVAGDEYETLMSVDYSQIEMRIMAHLSEDRGLIEAFNSGEDLHKTMAAMVFEVPVDEVTPQLRGQIKATSYGLAYGLSPFGLSRQLGIGVDEAKRLHAQYFERFGGVQRYLRNVVKIARETGYTETMFGRRRYFPDLNSQNHRVREMAERAALNAPIQGSAADIIKVATNSVADALQDQQMQTRIILQIHDELLMEIGSGEVEKTERIVRQAMASPVHMSVPLEVAVGIGRSWKEAAH